jgi:succinate dehydrogenase / fumarate reductase, flavoprotein subunit
MDFTRNPQAVPGDLPFSLDRLDADVLAYLGENDALLATPIERLRRMNPLSIELYRRYRKDLTRQALPFNVNNQHMNGGVAVDIWGQSSLPGCYAIGETAGTHGVTRPGGAALNAGQVLAIRCAAHIRAHLDARPSTAGPEVCVRPAEARLERIREGLRNAQGLTIEAVRRDIQARMSDRAGFVCRASEVAEALREAEALTDAVRRRGIAIPDVSKIADAALWSQMALTSQAVLLALQHYIARGGGSRGARVLCSPSGTEVPATRLGPLEAFRFLAEREADRHAQIRVRYEDGRLGVRDTALRDLERLEGISFEKHWTLFLTGHTYRAGEPAESGSTDRD